MKGEKCMQQVIKAEVEITIPSDCIVISRVEYDRLKVQELLGTYWTMADLEERIGKGQVWIKENVLYPTKFKQQLDVSLGGFVYYPTVKGEKWSFHANKMAQFLEDNFYTIFGSSS